MKSLVKGCIIIEYVVMLNNKYDLLGRREIFAFAVKTFQLYGMEVKAKLKGLKSNDSSCFFNCFFCTFASLLSSHIDYLADVVIVR